jgi:hypothetical protein
VAALKRGALVVPVQVEVVAEAIKKAAITVETVVLAASTKTINKYLRVQNIESFRV